MTPADNGDIIILYNNNICFTLIDSGLSLFSRSELRISLTVRIFGFYTVAFCVLPLSGRKKSRKYTHNTAVLMCFL